MTADQYAALGAGAGATIAGIAVSGAPTSTKVEASISTGLATAAAIPTPASPFLAIASGVSALLGVFGIGSGCGQTCITASDYANKTADLAKQNMDIYFAIPTPRPLSLQREALANFDQIWGALVNACSNPALGSAGQRCISERQPGGKYDFTSYYRTPIANDTNVYDDTQPVSPIVPSPTVALPTPATNPIPSITSPNPPAPTSGISSLLAPLTVPGGGLNSTGVLVLTGLGVLLIYLNTGGGDEE